ncbi:hypothetical protein EVAR_16857_1 [Eumeta japonica]|uniref:Uncharacterized protein n=1 Tax=Eumeta variegata TaxID=151549 RepID=A0A4C1V3S8_EUMVA|nr:hypothetical protein EVAR_16857_1 [Eumeta japonica]
MSQLETVAILFNHHTLTQYRCKVAASAVAFRSKMHDNAHSQIDGFSRRPAEPRQSRQTSDTAAPPRLGTPRARITPVTPEMASVRHVLRTSSLIIFILLLCDNNVDAQKYVRTVSVDGKACDYRSCDYSLRIESDNAQLGVVDSPGVEGGPCSPVAVLHKDPEGSPAGVRVSLPCFGGKYYFCAKSGGVWLHQGEGVFLEACGDVIRAGRRMYVTRITYDESVDAVDAVCPEFRIAVGCQNGRHAGEKEEGSGTVIPCALHRTQAIQSGKVRTRYVTNSAGALVRQLFEYRRTHRRYPKNDDSKFKMSYKAAVTGAHAPFLS